MRPELEAIATQLLQASAQAGAVTLDQIGDALGALAVSGDEIDALLARLEGSGRRIASDEARDRVADLRAVMRAARALQASLGRRPTTEELAAETSLAERDVRTALLLGRVMGR